MARITLLCRSSGTEEWRELLSECLRGAGSSSLVVAALFAADQLRVWELQPANADHMIQNTPPGLRYMLLFLRFRRNARRQRCDFPVGYLLGGNRVVAVEKPGTHYFEVVSEQSDESSA